ncbi:hypothetical protein PF005_g14091 [Phytophthora fragariae]|uniref:Uncharacterized protein n=1 Tax=Phytophthora fragariae TaxID=53985 RepID=A0A6A3S4Q5_9STRA|nr:hypothetical protein PF003_g17523 [Phytophthora fragariae]KAE8936743.1 hypothetical protein PF009_g13340 [Phytophthora fragariae]KAE9093122.1 hypothetical protein PF010_g17610 [Phytophthora fragariae]KAE9109098.1 hypothetical protein PF007_g12388 [Phytophthora fragariae]KAE9203660.1 hypothetical protein PF005_g14091 [Phytophthora fragariae]
MLIGTPNRAEARSRRAMQSGVQRLASRSASKDVFPPQRKLGARRSRRWVIPQVMNASSSST